MVAGVGVTGAEAGVEVTGAEAGVGVTELGEEVLAVMALVGEVLALMVLADPSRV
jgi:hypothetical protein